MAEIIDLRSPTQLRTDEEIQAYIVRDECIRHLIQAWSNRFPHNETPQEADLREKIFELSMDRLALAHADYNRTVASQLISDETR